MDKPNWTHRIEAIHGSDNQAGKNFLHGSLCCVEGESSENRVVPGYITVTLRVRDGGNDYGALYHFKAVQLVELASEAEEPQQSDPAPVMEESAEEPEEADTPFPQMGLPGNA